MQRRETGRCAEGIALRFLKKEGFKVIEKNFLCRLGEIDIIAKDGDETVFVEVRSAFAKNYFMEPLESIGPIKIEKVRRSALFWLNRHNIDSCNMRFDVVAVLFRQDFKKYEVTYIKDAF
jgi:putative endonuclease